jgi:Bacteriophage baseplate protein W
MGAQAVNRHDYAFPFRIDPASRQGARTGYEAHVEQMIRQILLTSPGERADLPELGCGLRQLLFAPHSDAVDSTTQILVKQALDRWLASQITVKKVSVGPGNSGDASQILVEIDYVLTETQSQKQINVLVS